MLRIEISGKTEDQPNRPDGLVAGVCRSGRSTSRRSFNGSSSQRCRPDLAQLTLRNQNGIRVIRVIGGRLFFRTLVPISVHSWFDSALPRRVFGNADRRATDPRSDLILDSAHSRSSVDSTLVNSCSRFAVRSAVRCQYSCTSTARLTEARLQLVNRVQQSQRFLVRQNRLFHLVHYVRERDFVFRIGKSMAAARTGMPEGCYEWSEHPARCIS
jgi:hypothetical protein